MKKYIPQFLPHILAIALFLTIGIAYFSPVFKGKTLSQSDVKNYKGAAQEIVDFRKQYGEEPLWTNSMFGGMPAFQISVQYKKNVLQYINKIFMLGLPHPVGMVFLYFLGFYILLITLKVDPWVSIIGAVAFSFSSYFFIILEAGHNTKALAIGYIAPVFAGVVLTMRKNYLLGLSLTSLFLGLELYANHVQITYYLFLLLFIYVLFQFISSWKQNAIKDFLKSTAILIVSGIIAVSCNAGNLLSTYSYGKHTTRGPSELTTDKDNKTSGLDKDYATDWSYGIGETMTLLIPDFKGGASGRIGTEKNALKEVSAPLKESVSQMDKYWGDQPFTSGPVYVGAAIVFLFILGIFIVEGPLKWTLLLGTLLSFMLAWGRNFMGFNEWMLDYFPGYNKFRAVSMTLVIAEFTIPLLALLALDSLLKKKEIMSDKMKLFFTNKEVSKKNMFFTAFAITGGLALLLYLMPGAFTTFTKSNELEKTVSAIQQSGSAEGASNTQIMDYVNELLAETEKARITILKSDAIRSFFIILLVAALIYLYLKSNLNKTIALIGIFLIVLTDLWMVDKRYLNKDSFVTKKEDTTPFAITAADQFILNDKTPDYRVLNIAANTFNDASTSYYHKSIGGYHGAKLKRYQELIESQISGEIQKIISTFRSNPSDSALRVTFSQLGVLNMLNAKYIIYNPEAQPLQNRYALGNAWFVKEYKLVANADSELIALNYFNPRTEAIIDKRFEKELIELKLSTTIDGSIELKEYKPNHLTYSSSCSTNNLAVFSEIYYQDGWNAYIDGQLKTHIRANYVLRALPVPAGKHTIEFKFEPKSYLLGENISLAGSILLVVSIIGTMFYEFRKNSRV